MPILPVFAFEPVPVAVRRDDDMGILTTARSMPEFVDVRIGSPDMDLIAISEMRDNAMANLRVGKGDGSVRWETRPDGWSPEGDTITVVAHHDVDGKSLNEGRARRTECRRSRPSTASRSCPRRKSVASSRLAQG